MNAFSRDSGEGSATRSGTAAFTSKPRTTRKARHKDDRARVTAHALSVGRTGKAQDRRMGSLEPPPDNDLGAQEVPVVPKRENGEPDEARERRRRDIGSRVVLYELGAPDNPEELSVPFADPQGAQMRWAVQCITHDGTRYFSEHRQAVQGVKASQTWCDGCADAAAANRHMRNKQRLRMRRASQ